LACSVHGKQVPNVLQSHECAKRVLREICILRRMRHPNIIALLDVFMQVPSLPSVAGRAR
jgi:serine/threonine protein kinase